MSTTRQSNARQNKQKSFSVTQAAEELEVSPSTVRDWCRKGLVGTLNDFFGQDWYVLTEKEVDRMRNPNNRPRMGRPPKEGSGAT